MGQTLSSSLGFIGSPISWLRLRSATSRNGILALIACVCVTLIGTEVWKLWQLYGTNIEQTDIVSSNTAEWMAEQAETTLQTADTVVATLVAQVEAEGTGPEALTRFYRLMTSLAVALPAIHEMGIVDSQGNAIAKSLKKDPTGLNYAERGYFHYHATHADRGPFIGARIKSKIDGNYSITVTRRINHPDGSFAGLAVTSVSLDFFQQLFNRVQVKSGGVISLIADDGSVLARSPVVQTKALENQGSGFRQEIPDVGNSGSLSYVSAVDGVRRRGSYQHLVHFPVTALAAQSEWDVQSSWRAELKTNAIVLGCVMVVVVALGRRAVKATRMLGAQALLDGLTGLSNRRSFDETLAREMRRAARSGQPLSLIMIDIDHFKDYNDCYGHPAGDDCLRAVAHTIRGCLRRAGEFAARYGGEEFAILLPGSDSPKAVAFGETIRLAVRGLALQQAHRRGGVITLSAGVATWVAGQTAGDSQTLVEVADAALYAAKAGGRDMVNTLLVPAIAGARVVIQAADDNHPAGNDDHANDREAVGT
jgi:diguanylate cyclase (GGDEF)-like protein